MALRVRRAGDLGLLVETSDLAQAMSLEARLRSDGLPGVTDIVCGASTVLLVFASRNACRTALPRVEAMRPERISSPSRSLVEIGVHYDGADLAATADLLGTSVEALVAAHAASPWSVAFGGFAPGWAYLIRGDRPFDVPRLDSPRAKVPAGSVAIAGTYSGVYPQESSGGWRLLGRTAAVLWDPARDDPALLKPATDVRFVPQREVAVLAPPPRTAPPLRAGALLVEHVGLQALFQDAGRPGNGSLGVPSSGALDRASMRVANRAVGNRADAVVIETIGGMTLRADRELVLAVAGADAPLEVLAAGGRVREAVPNVAFAVHAGERLRISAPRRGFRSYLAVRGGFAVREVLGSAATDQHSLTGPEPIAVGTPLHVGDAAIASVEGVPVGCSGVDVASGALLVEVRLGPRDDWFDADSIKRFLSQEWEVSGQANRVGIRLLGEALTRARTDELGSEGMVTGAVQVPPNGQPVVFLADHPPTGGYPVIAVVADHHIDRLAQLRPGERVRFSNEREF